MGNELNDLKVYRPAKPHGKYVYVVLAILSVIVLALGLQNYMLKKNEVDVAEEPRKETKTSPTQAPENADLTQLNPTENWRIYRNLTYNYKFRTPKAYTADVNNQRNSVEIFNEGSQKVIEISVEAKSNSNTGEESPKKESVGNITYNVLEFPDGNGSIKSPFAVYKTSNEKYSFSLTFYNSVTLNEMEKLILSTFSELE